MIVAGLSSHIDGTDHLLADLDDEDTLVPLGLLSIDVPPLLTLMVGVSDLTVCIGADNEVAPSNRRCSDNTPKGQNGGGSLS
jgi:hypothetical protein